MSSSTPPAVRPSREEETLAEALVRRGDVSREDIEAALHERKGDDSAPSLMELLVRRGSLSPEAAREVERLVREETAAAGTAATVFVNRSARSGDGGPDIDPRDHAGKPFGRYRLLRELGRGGMGIVWLAWDTQLRREVALKQVLRREGDEGAQGDRFLREARLAAKLRHPGIVALLDAGESDGVLYFTCDYIPGEPLDARLERGRVSARQAALWVKAVAEALAFAHDQGIVHRDVKPGNILLDAQERPFVTDFGLAKEVPLPGASGSREACLTASGALVGTPQYMSPEQASGQVRRIGPASDQFSLGAVLYELLAGRPPFAGEGLQALLNAITGSDPQAPSRVVPNLHKDLETICLKSLEKDPARRYGTLAEMAADLGRFLEGEAICARPMSIAVRVARRAARHKVMVCGALLVLSIAAAFGIYAALAREERDVARADRLAAEELVAKSGRVQEVLARWLEVMDVVEGMERVSFDTSLQREEIQRRNEEAWRKVRTFLDATPADSASQATALALAGWTRRLGGWREEGDEMIQRSLRLDPDVPFAPFLLGVIAFAEYLAACPSPDVARLAGGGVAMRPMPPPTPAMAEKAAIAERWIAEATRRRVWGEGLARGLRTCADALRLYMEGRYEQAEAPLSEAIDSAVMRIYRRGLLAARGRSRLYAGRIDEACDDFRAVLAFRPGALHARVSIAFAESSRGNHDEAIRQADAILAEHPAYGEAWRVRAWARSAKGELREAIRDYEEARRLNPGRSTETWAIGRCRVELGEFEEAERELSAAMEMEGDNGDLLVDRAEARIGLGDRAGARADLEKAIRLLPAGDPLRDAASEQLESLGPDGD